MDMNLGKLQEMVRDGEADMLQSMGLWRVRHDWATEKQQVFTKCVLWAQDNRRPGIAHVTNVIKT